MEDYLHLQAQGAVTASKERVQQEGTQKVELTFVDSTWRENEDNKALTHFPWSATNMEEWQSDIRDQQAIEQSHM